MIFRTTLLLTCSALIASCSGLAPQDAWRTKNENDAITGQNLLTAEQKLAGDAFDAEVVVSCRDLNHLEYKLTTFDKEGQPAPLQTQQDMNWGPYVLYQVRMDEQPARFARMTMMRYNNQVIFQTKLGARGLGAAQQIVVRLPLAGGEETYIIDQSDEALHTVLDPCVASQQRGIDEREAARMQPEPEPEPAPEPEPTPADVTPTASDDVDASAPVANEDTAQNASDDTDYQ